MLRNIKLICLTTSVIFISFKSSAQCPVSSGTEFIVNGNFSAGNVGFTTDFTFFPGPGTLGQDQYAITTNPNNFNSGFFRNMGDHTTGTGNMLIFDFANNGINDAVYRTTVPVVTGQTYFFSAWFANIAINNFSPCPECPGGQKITNSPILKFRIGGVDQGIISVDSLTNNWNQYFTPYTATSTGNITIEIINLRGGMASNDLALDDISFSNSCAQIADLNSYGRRTELVNTLNACNVGFPYNLTTNRSASNYNFRWLDNSGVTIPGQTNPNFTISTAPGSATKYIVCYDSIADGLNGCWKKDTVTVVNTPLSVNLGNDIVMCAPINVTLNSSMQNPPVDIIWRKDGVVIPSATSGTLIVTEPGTYRVDASRSGCGAANDEIVVSSPVQSFTGTGTYCETNNTASFSVTGATEVKWFTTATGGTPLNPTNSNPDISLAYNQTVTNVSGCESGLYAQDIGSYPGALMSTAPCAPSNSSSRVDLMIDVTQTAVLQSIDFFQNTGWGSTGTFTFTLSNNNPTGGPWCGSCSPSGNKDGVGTSIYSQVSPSLTVGGSNTVRTMTLNTPQTLNPGRYWLSIQASGTALGNFTCNRALNSNGSWSIPLTDNTGNNVISATKSIFDGNVQGSGGIFNLGFQVGSSNACSRLFICASRNCPTPADFVNFTVSQKANGLHLNWTVANEFEVKRYTIMASDDGSVFTPVSSLNAKNQSGLLFYSAGIENNEKWRYLKIRIENQDGSTAFSQTISLAPLKESSGFTLFNNKFKKGENLSLKMENETMGEVGVIIRDSKGKVLMNKKSIISNEIDDLEISGLESGLYFVELLIEEQGVRKTTNLVIE
ncbi:MAG: hypothetical protein SNJ77_11920 [Cytophagales bacterium]